MNLATGVWNYFNRTPNATALATAARALSYRELGETAAAISALLRIEGIGAGDRVVLMVGRSTEAYEALLGAVWSGAAYVAVSLKFPEERILTILELTKPSALVVDAEGAKYLSNRLTSAAPDVILIADADAEWFPPARSNQKVIQVSRDALVSEVAPPVNVDASTPAYVMFTSGSTGVPKGVIQSTGSVNHFLGVMQERYVFSPSDRVAQPAELNFDLSVFNMFMAWNAGASVFPVPSNDAMAPGAFIRKNEITAWLSVPSVIGLMKRMSALQPGSLPTLRYSFFCGEPLQLAAVESWRAAAPQSVIENLYGPTEAIISHHQRVETEPAVTPERSIVAIGKPLAGLSARIVGDALEMLPPTQHGEIAISGPQLAIGYLGMPELSRERFPLIDRTRWYLTGDLGYMDNAGVFHFLGRVDNQVKVRGYRVELEEVEAILRRVTQTEIVAAVAWPVSHGAADGIVCFVAGVEMSPAEIRDGLRDWLPEYMVPSSVISLESLPLTANRKVDRKALIMLLERGVTAQ